MELVKLNRFLYIREEIEKVISSEKNNDDKVVDLKRIEKN
jgi:hypothetical protein